jgi:hypothetical protein
LRVLRQPLTRGEPKVATAKATTSTPKAKAATAKARVAATAKARTETKRLETNHINGRRGIASPATAAVFEALP